MFIGIQKEQHHYRHNDDDRRLCRLWSAHLGGMGRALAVTKGRNPRNQGKTQRSPENLVSGLFAALFVLDLSANFDVNAGAALSFSQLDIGRTTSVSLFNDNSSRPQPTVALGSRTQSRVQAGPTQFVSQTSAAPAGVMRTAELARLAARVRA
jgi:hypothetical protein